MNGHILIVDDERGMCEMLEVAMRSRGFEPAWCWPVSCFAPHPGRSPRMAVRPPPAEGPTQHPGPET